MSSTTDNQTILDEVERTVPPTNFGDGVAAGNIWNERFELVMVGQRDLETAVPTIVEQVNSVLQRP